MSAVTAANASAAQRVVRLGLDMGWAAVGIADIELSREAEGYQAWVAAGHHGEMEYMVRHGSKRWQPDDLQPGTRSVICVALDYWPEHAADAEATLQSRDRAYVSRYALGRDYHKVLRNKLQAFGERISERIAAHDFRVFTDSAPVMEIPLAAKAGLGWRGKHTLLLNRERGSLFFLGEIYTSLNLSPAYSSTSNVGAGSTALPASPSAVEPAPTDQGEAGPTGHCGSCTACIDICPTRAITAPHRLDARRCISYLTIEHKGSIPEEFRKPMGNRIYGCDDCQLVCPWNKFARKATIPDFEPRNGLDGATLVELFAWTEADFNERLQGSPIHRIGHQRWLRNIAIALGNAPQAPEVQAALQSRAAHPADLMREHVAWALAQQNIL